MDSSGSSSVVSFKHTSVGVPSASSLFGQGRGTWSQNFQDTGMIADGQLTNLGRLTFHTLSPGNWLEYNSDGVAYTHADLRLAASLIGNVNARNPDQRKFNDICHQLLLLDFAAQDQELENSREETKNEIKLHRTELRTTFTRFQEHLDHEDRLESGTRARADWEEAYQDHTTSVAEGAQNLADLVSNPNGSSTIDSVLKARSTQVPQTVHEDAASARLPRLDTAIKSRQSWESNRTPDQEKTRQSWESNRTPDTYKSTHRAALAGQNRAIGEGLSQSGSETYRSAVDPTKGCYAPQGYDPLMKNRRYSSGEEEQSAGVTGGSRWSLKRFARVNRRPGKEKRSSDV